MAAIAVGGIDATSMRCDVSIVFRPAGILAFAGCMLASMHQRWPILTSVLYFASGLLIMIGFYSLFRYALHVPLP